MTVSKQSFRPAADHQRVFDQIWSQFPERQNWASSSWWFFLLFPRDKGVYGPRQLVFTIAARAGDEIQINDIAMPGIDLDRSVEKGVDRFHAMALGWYCDGRQMHHNYVNQDSLTTMSYPDGVITCGLNKAEGQPYGIAFRRSAHRPLTMEADIYGPAGEAHFEAWGSLETLTDSPDNSMDIASPLGGTHYIGWRRMQFGGDFDLPTGREKLEGIGFFQRVCMNIPLFPWKWMWALFPDGSMLTLYIPYIGLNFFRNNGYRFFSDKKERHSLPAVQSGFFLEAGSQEPVRFNRAAATPRLDHGPHPQFEVSLANKAGDQVSFLAETYTHSRYTIDRQIWGGRATSHWDYNEYPFKVVNLEGQIGGRPFNLQSMGQGFGNMEYTWGLGL